MEKYKVFNILFGVILQNIVVILQYLSIITIKNKILYKIYNNNTKYCIVNILHQIAYYKMFKCIKCNKEFEFESEYNRHKNRKTPCNQPKEELECKSCNLKFTRLFNKKNMNKQISIFKIIINIFKIM